MVMLLKEGNIRGTFNTFGKSFFGSFLWLKKENYYRVRYKFCYGTNGRYNYIYLQLVKKKLSGNAFANISFGSRA